MATMLNRAMCSGKDEQHKSWTSAPWSICLQPANMLPGLKIALCGSRHQVLLVPTAWEALNPLLLFKSSLQGSKVQNNIQVAVKYVTLILGIRF